MNRNDLYRSFSEIDDLTLIEVEAYKRRKHPYVIFSFVAASLTVVLLVSGIAHFFLVDTPNQISSSWFVITAQGTEGSQNELDLNDGYFNSGGTNQNISLFPADVKLFSFAVEPANFGNNENIYSQFDVSVSYNNKVVDSLDEHIVVYHIIPTGGSDGARGYEVIGWFEEITDINITVVDKNTGDLVEEIIVNIQPQQGESTYKLTVTNVDTYDIK